MAEDEDEEENEDDTITCERCKKKVEEYLECDECGQFFCGDCAFEWDSIGCLCKNCIDEKYPREKEVVEKVVEKIVEIPKETIKVMGFSEPIL